MIVIYCPKCKKYEMFENESGYLNETSFELRTYMWREVLYTFNEKTEEFDPEEDTEIGEREFAYIIHNACGAKINLPLERIILNIESLEDLEDLEEIERLFLINNV